MIINLLQKLAETCEFKNDSANHALNYEYVDSKEIEMK